jgi:hypothetical protein
VDISATYPFELVDDRDATPGFGYGTFSRGGDLGLREALWSGKISILISSR